MSNYIVPLLLLMVALLALIYPLPILLCLMAFITGTLLLSVLVVGSLILYSIYLILAGAIKGNAGMPYDENDRRHQ